MRQILFLLFAQTEPAVAADPAVPVWGWITIVGALASAVGTLATLYKGARDREVAAVNEKVELAKSIGDKMEPLLAKSIEVFTLSKSTQDALAGKFEDLIDEFRGLREEVRRVLEKSK